MSTKSSMSTLVRFGGLALFALFAARPVVASELVPGAFTTYPTRGTRIVDSSNVVPGPIASHLVYLGESRDQAIADAREQGEQPRIAQADTGKRARSSFETYQEVEGLSPLSTQFTRKTRANVAPAHS